MKKTILALVSVVCLSLGLLSGCSNAKNPAAMSGSASAEHSAKLKVVTTIFPEYDWIRNILGEQLDNTEVSMLLDNGVDLHSYKPSAADIKKIVESDVFVYVGGESDEWVNDVLKQVSNKKQVVVNLMELMGERAKLEETVEGMEGEHDHDHDGAEEDHTYDNHDAHDQDADEHEDEAEYDEHVWLSLKHAQHLVQGIANALGTADPSHAQMYTRNAKTYNKELQQLSDDYQKAVDGATQKTLLFADRFPFRYLVDDYGLSYYAAFSGCSAESEASFETIRFLADKTDELGLKTLLTIEHASPAIAETVRANTKTKNQTIAVMDSLQSTTAADVEAGANYLKTMKDNLEVLKAALA
ncbi:metal ABC transporter substrate-binding protein [Collinsella sp. zg1085]|uniref:metal ABC transporter substrate-binding protein n=1 Tax=Collinsella sp. zg1085 TaxID=2844380 RepID=UPI001C0CB334|nr:metal ABC transporter substrate-binding protein [Collinsella sp. zg1085]QWT18166.1 metal ABC transporter substrate-binding protein [Collinsella sp. zg1085]